MKQKKLVRLKARQVIPRNFIRHFSEGHQNGSFVASNSNKVHKREQKEMVEPSITSTNDDMNDDLQSKRSIISNQTMC